MNETCQPWILRVHFRRTYFTILSVPVNEEAQERYTMRSLTHGHPFVEL